MISLKQLSNYFEKLSRQNLSISHTSSKPRFFRLKGRELGAKLDKADEMILVLETPEFTYSDNQADNYMKDKTSAFSILKRCKSDDFDAIDDAVDLCEAVSHEIVTVMHRDNRSYNDQLFGNLPLNTFGGFKVGPVFDGFYGIRVEFKYGDFITMCVDESKWNFNLGN